VAGFKADFDNSTLGAAYRSSRSTVVVGSEADFGESNAAFGRAAAIVPLLPLLGSAARRIGRVTAVLTRLSTTASLPAVPLLPGMAAVRAVGRTAAAVPLLPLLDDAARRIGRMATMPHRLSTPHRFSVAATLSAVPLLPVQTRGSPRPAAVPPTPATKPAPGTPRPALEKRTRFDPQTASRRDQHHHHCVQDRGWLAMS
jgi:hypothetical protein